MEDIIEQEKKYLVEVLGKKLIDSDERDDRKLGYKVLAKKYWPEEFKDEQIKHVHHIDFNHSNNVVSNLVVLTPSEHSSIHSMFDIGYMPSFSGLHHSEETKKILSELRKGKRPWNKGKTLSEETRQKISIARKQYLKNRKGSN